MSKTPRSVIDGFLEGRRIAFVGLSTHEEDFSRSVDRQLTAAGYQVVPVHPGVRSVGQRAAFARVSDIPFKVDGALIMTPADTALDVVEDCMRAGVMRVWLHRGLGHGSVSEAAVAYAEAHGMQVVAGECPLMFLPGASAPHRIHALAKKVAGSYPLAADEARPRGVFSTQSALTMIGLDWVVFASTMLWGLSALTLATSLGVVGTAALTGWFERRAGRTHLASWLRAAVAALAVGLPWPAIGTLLGLVSLIWHAFAHDLPHATKHA